MPRDDAFFRSIAAFERRCLSLAKDAGRGPGAVKLRYSSLRTFRPSPEFLLVGENAAGNEADHASEASARARPDYSAYLDESWVSHPPGEDFRQQRTQAIAMILTGSSASSAIARAEGTGPISQAAVKFLRSNPSIQLFPFRSKSSTELQVMWPTLRLRGRELTTELIRFLRPKVIVSLGSGKESAWHWIIENKALGDATAEVHEKVAGNHASYKRGLCPLDGAGGTRVLAVSHLTRPWHRDILTAMAADRDRKYRR
jgi:hypothetical protein